MKILYQGQAENAVSHVTKSDSTLTPIAIAVMLTFLLTAGVFMMYIMSIKDALSKNNEPLIIIRNSPVSGEVADDIIGSGGSSAGLGAFTPANIDSGTNEDNDDNTGGQQSVESEGVLIGGGGSGDSGSDDGTNSEDESNQDLDLTNPDGDDETIDESDDSTDDESSEDESDDEEDGGLPEEPSVPICIIEPGTWAFLQHTNNCQ